jgi:hypothetical protein
VPAPNRPEPNIDFVPSIVHNGYRLRPIWSSIYTRPLSETFHEFLINIVKWTFGQDWWRHQIAMRADQRHAVVRWNYDFAALTRDLDRAQKSERDGVGPLYAVQQSGPVASLLQLGYDLLCLQAKDRLPTHTVQKLRRHADFQGARYEIAAAAIMARAGFSIEFLDDGAVHERHCEFIATHSRTGVTIAVEAKSRVRAGILNAPGDFEYSEDWRGIQNLVRKAKKQRPDGLPFLIFVDVNLPPTPGIPWPDKPWMRDVKRMLDSFGTPTAQNREPYTAIVPTNYAQYYGEPLGPAPPAEWGLIVSSFPEVEFPDHGDCLNDIVESLGRYGKIPPEI